MCLHGDQSWLEHSPSTTSSKYKIERDEAEVVQRVLVPTVDLEDLLVELLGVGESALRVVCQPKYVLPRHEIGAGRCWTLRLNRNCKVSFYLIRWFR